MLFFGKKNKTFTNINKDMGDITGTERTAHISHTFSPQWLMQLWKEAAMAVARIHGKVKCRPFKEKRRRAPFTTWRHWRQCLWGFFVLVFFSPLLNFSCPAKVSGVLEEAREQDVRSSGFSATSLAAPTWKHAEMVGGIRRPKPVWVSHMNSWSNGKAATIPLV